MPSCSRQRCFRPASIEGLCKTHATAKADANFAAFIRERDGRCMAAELVPQVKCNGNLQCMHLVSRSYRTTRWCRRNAAAGCAAHHTYLTHHPLEHLRFCEDLKGDKWQAIRRCAEAGDKTLARRLMESWL